MKLILLHILLFFSVFNIASAQQRKVIIDADTGNEVDDLYAIVRALIEPSWEILSLNAAQWQSSQWSIPNTMEESERLNELLLSYLHLSNQIPTKRGGQNRMYDWGDKAQHSAACYSIIQQAHQIPPSNKLSIVVLGALTNVASAIYIDPSISDKIKVYWLGTSYDFEKNIMKKLDFNAVMDVQALEIMLNSDVEMHIIPTNVAGKLAFNFEETQNRLNNVCPLGHYLIRRWENHIDAGRYTRHIWDLALIEAMIHPEFATEVEITTSAENGNKKIGYYQTIDIEKMREDFYDTAIKHMKKNELKNN